MEKIFTNLQINDEEFNYSGITCVHKREKEYVGTLLSYLPNMPPKNGKLKITYRMDGVDLGSFVYNYEILNISHRVGTDDLFTELVYNYKAELVSDFYN